MNDHLLDVALRLKSVSMPDCRAVTGFDGFVDEMITLVEERCSLTDFTPVPNIATFGGLISSAAGQRELGEFLRQWASGFIKMPA